MNPFALIPARGGSKGVPKKNIMPFCGLPLIAWSIKQAKGAGLPVWISTDDDDIARCAREFGAGVIMRPAELATDTAPTIPVLQHALKNVPVDSLDTVVLLQPTSPLRLSTDISAALRSHDDKGAKYTLSCHKTRLYEWNVDEPEFPYGTTPRRQDIPLRTIEHGMIYIYDECYEPLGLGELRYSDINFYETQNWQAHEIDELEDIDICEYYMRRRILCLTEE